MEKTICIFGDSIAWGAWDPKKGGWNAHLRSYFEINNIPVNIFNCSVSGDNTNDLLKRFKVETLAREPNIIIFAIGINDSQYSNSKDNSSQSIQKFQNNLQEMVNQAKSFTKQIIFIGLTKVDESKTMPVPWDTTRYYDNGNILLYNSKIKEICDKNNLQFIEMLGLLKNKDLEDGLHPNHKGHKKMFGRIKKFLVDNKIV